VNRPLLILAGGVLLVTVGGIAMRQASRADAQNALPSPVLPGKAEDRRATGAETSSKEAKALVERWSASLLEAKPDPAATRRMQEACKHLSLQATRELLEDDSFGWQPSTIYFGRLAALHTALLERLGELDPEALRDLPVSAPEGYGEGWLPLAGFFKGVASKDGVRAFDLLREWLPAGNEAMRAEFLGPLVEGWAHGDPEAAWTWLAGTSPFDAGWELAAKAYFAGLDQAKWDDFPKKLEALWRQDSSGGLVGEATLRLELTKRWMRDDPAAALRFYGTPSSNRYTIDEFSAGIEEPAVILSRVVAPGLESDPAAGEKLADALAKTSALFKDTHPDDVFAVIANNASSSPELREKARAQIRDPEGVERRRAEKGK
jgi:hypothetical protein